MKVAQLCPTLSNPMGFTVHGILQARILEWVAVPFSSGSSKLGIKPRSPALQADSLLSEPPGKLRSHKPCQNLKEPMVGNRSNNGKLEFESLYVNLGS